MHKMSNSNHYLSTAVLISLFFSFSMHLLAHGTHTHDHELESRSMFIANQGQWHENVLYKAPLQNVNTVFLEDSGFTYVFYDATDVAQLHDVSQMSNEEKTEFCLNGFAYKTKFVGAKEASIDGEAKLSTYHNYFTGNDPEKWASKVPIYGAVNYQDLYEGINLRTYLTEGQFKYDLIVAPGANPNNILVQYDGVTPEIQDGDLVIETSVGIFREKAPYTYQIVNGVEKEIASNYASVYGQITYEFPDGYDESLPLIIDPVVVGATLSGSTGFSSNYGHCAAFDSGGNIYTGAISFDSGYPTDAGSFQSTFGGGGTDIAISKLNPDGTDLLYATFLGGSGSDYPHSIYVDLNLNAHIYGTTTSTNYPTSADAFDDTFNSPTSGFSTDIVVTVLTEDGDALIGSTYVGGAQEDGTNTTSTNYGDTYRGEIVVDFYGNSYVSSCSSSTDFPTTDDVMQTDHQGGQDGVLFKLNEDLSEMVWCTYLGSSGDDMAYGLRIDKDDKIYVCGSAGGDDFPVDVGGYDEEFNGSKDAFIIWLENDGKNILGSTYWGTTTDEWAFFIDIDNVDDIAIFGQSEGTIELIPDDVYNQADSKQFIVSFSPDLTNIKYSTKVGGGSGFGGFGLVPVAFMIDNCGYIYFSGYNATAGLELTSDAILTTGGFYVGVLDENALGLYYATYYTGNHVDGGTSRFDDNGIVYQGVCSGGGFQTNPDAYATTQSTGWDIGVFKIDFQVPSVNAESNAVPETTGCVPLEVDFTNLGSFANEFFWDFGDGTTSTEETPSHTYTEAGSYVVMLLASDSLSCNLADTSYIDIFVLNPDDPNITEYNICPFDQITLDVTNDPTATYLWQDGSTEPIYEASEPGTYWVITDVFNCEQTDSFYIYAVPDELDLGPDTTLCTSIGYQLDATTDNASVYVWQDGTLAPTYNVTESGLYWVIATVDGCNFIDSVNVDLTALAPLDIGPDQSICQGETFTIDATYADANTYTWQDGSSAATFTVSEPGTYWVVINEDESCFVTDTLIVSQPIPEADLGEDFTLCDGETFTFDVSIADPSATYLWQDGSTDPVYTVSDEGTYDVTISINDCTVNSSVNVTADPLPVLDVGPDVTLCLGDTISFNLDPDAGDYVWQDGTVGPNYTVTDFGTYQVTLSNNCGSVQDEIVVDYIDLPDVENPILMPTGFSPNYDGINDSFAPTIVGVVENYEFMIYDRWGQQILKTTDTNVSWDGMKNGGAMELGVYVWYCTATVTNCRGTFSFSEKGNVTMMR